VHQGKFIDLTVGDFDRMIAVHLRGTFLCTHAVLRGMLARGSGVIVNIASQLGQIGGIELVHYSAAKAGIIGMTKALAREVSAQGVRVNAVAPGWIASSGMDTYGGAMRAFIPKLKQHVPLRRMGVEAEVSAAIVFLLSPAAAFITGITVQIDGAASLGSDIFPLGDEARSSPFQGFHRAVTPDVLK
jgi:citronellol/citronellal dehydrogenase